MGAKRKFAITQSNDFNFGGLVVTVQISDTMEGFFHRLKVGKIEGTWEQYEGIATFAHDDGNIYAHVTEYWSHNFPTEVVFIFNEKHFRKLLLMQSRPPSEKYNGF